MRVRLHDRVEHDVVLGIGHALLSNSFRLSDAGAYVGEHACMVAHPFLPVGLHFLLCSLSCIWVGLLPVGYHGCRSQIRDQETLHRTRSYFAGDSRRMPCVDHWRGRWAVLSKKPGITGAAFGWKKVRHVAASSQPSIKAGPRKTGRLYSEV